MHATRRELISQRWNVVQYELIPELTRDFGPLTPKLKQVVHTLEWVR
ncbi:MAG: IS5/IS1182 family transposase, partial [Zoogloeaceae bacterium]|nr:IS5/IS1182 family transposase [Zoogloeaceae bacterium]